MDHHRLLVMKCTMTLCHIENFVSYIEIGRFSNAIILTYDDIFQ